MTITLPPAISCRKLRRMHSTIDPDHRRRRLQNRPRRALLDVSAKLPGPYCSDFRYSNLVIATSSAAARSQTGIPPARLILPPPVMLVFINIQDYQNYSKISLASITLLCQTKRRVSAERESHGFLGSQGPRNPRLKGSRVAVREDALAVALGFCVYGKNGCRRWLWMKSPTLIRETPCCGGNRLD